MKCTAAKRLFWDLLLKLLLQQVVQVIYAGGEDTPPDIMQIREKISSRLGAKELLVASDSCVSRCKFSTLTNQQVPVPCLGPS